MDGKRFDSFILNYETHRTDFAALPSASTLISFQRIYLSKEMVRLTPPRASEVSKSK